MLHTGLVSLAVVCVVCASYGASVYVGSDLADAHITAVIGMFVLYITH